MGESRSEQKLPLLEESEDPEELSIFLVLLDMLKKLLSCVTACFMSLALSGKDQVLLLLPPNMGSCLTAVGVFFSGVEMVMARSSSRPWIKWQRGP